MKNYKAKFNLIWDNLDLIFLTFYLFFLPVAHVATLQAIGKVTFSLWILYKYRDYKKFFHIFKFKGFCIAFGFYILLSFLTLFHTVDVKETFKEIRHELLYNLLFFWIFFYYALHLSQEKIKKIIFILASILFFHGTINIFIWVKHGGWPFRAGGLLDTPGGERFGIWITYFLSLSIAFLHIYWRNLKNSFLLILGILFFILAIINVIASAGPTIISAFLVFCSYLFFVFFINLSKKFKVFFALIILIFILIFWKISYNFPPRYNIHITWKCFTLAFKLAPAKFDKLPTESVVYERLSMWKSAILYRIKNPFTPIEYSRFLFGKSIKKLFKHNPENLPVKIYPQVHSDFIGTLYGLGIFGLLTFLYILFYKLHKAFLLFKHATYPANLLGLFVFLGTIGYMGAMFFISGFGDSEAKFFYFLYALLLGTYLNLEDSLA